MFDNEALPMYKDKPFGHGPSRRKPIWKKKRTLGSLTLGLVFLLYMMGFFSSGSEKKASVSSWTWMGMSKEKGVVDWDKRREHVVEAFQLSWDAYERYAWGMENP
jgi:mannosyl-oligosaccharide alpha-1,2-mannosidase